MTQKICKLKVVNSTMQLGRKSLRGPAGRGMDDSIHKHVTAAGFDDGEDVWLVNEEFMIRHNWMTKDKEDK